MPRKIEKIMYAQKNKRVIKIKKWPKFSAIIIFLRDFDVPNSKQS
jgi:hypothetical protein